MSKKSDNKKFPVLFMSRYFYPHIGGVEKQVLMLSTKLIKMGFDLTVVTEKYSPELRERETINGIHIIRFPPIRKKLLGLLSIWWWLFKNRVLIKEAKIIHIHSVYIWYWPFRILFLKKPSYVTFHGWEGKYPIPFKNILIRKIDALLAKKNITISDYVQKYYGIKADKLMYTSVDLPQLNKSKKIQKNLKNIIYVGRLDEDTGLNNILTALSLLKNYHFIIDFCGDGPLRGVCEKYGVVHGFVDPHEFYEKAFICLSPGHTSILEAFTYKCLIITTYNNPLKRDYLKMTPFKKWICVESTPRGLANKILFYYKRPEKAGNMINNAYNWVKTQNWENAIRLYLNLWGLDKN